MESDVEKKGNMMAKMLADNKISVVLIPESAIYAVIPRVNKIFLGTIYR